MRRRHCWKGRLLVSGILLLLALGILVHKMRPMIREMAAARVENRAQSVINEAVEMLLNSEAIDYDHIIYLEKDVYGTITALKTNIAEVNRLKSKILTITDQLLLDLDISEIGLPLGSVIFPTFFSGSGPKLPVKVLSVSNSDAEFHNEFSEAGINQTSHQVMMYVIVHMTILTPVGTESIEVVSSVVVAQTVVVGDVPKSFVNVGE